MEMKFTDEQIAHIREQAAIYQCACPAQVCVALSGLRQLYEYQRSCLEGTRVDRAVHEAISASSVRAHEELERCLEDVLKLEGWDLETLEMPKDLQKMLLS